MKKNIFVSLIFLASCATENVEIEKHGSVEFNRASASLIANTKDLLLKIGKTSRVNDAKFSLANFNPNDLKEIVVSDGVNKGTSYGITSKTNPEVGLLVSFDELGNVLGTLYTENSEISAGVVDTKLYDMEGNLRVYFTTTHSEIMFHDVPAVNGRVTGWFSDTGDCISSVAQPFSNGLLNLAFDAAATYATDGAYPFVLAAACGIYAAFK